MSDPKRGTLITVGVPKSAKNNVNKTVRLTINLVESNESKYPELNYKELVIAEEKKKRSVQNGKTGGLDPFSDNDDDVERVARKFEQKYGGKSTYGRKGRSKQDDFADIGAGYDENDSFIDNTHGYDEMIPLECDTFYGGFYINSGSLEFKTVPQDQAANSDDGNNRRNKRRISSSSSGEVSSDSSSECESQDEKDTKQVPNGTLHSHNTDNRKKKNKKNDKNKPSKVRRTDSSAANSGKQTSDDNGHVDGESVDSRTSQSDSLTSKPAPSSENIATSDSSRDIESKTEAKLPATIVEILESLERSLELYMSEHPGSHSKILIAHTEPYLIRLNETIKQVNADTTTSKVVWSRAARALGSSRTKLLQRIKLIVDNTDAHTKDKAEPPEPPPTTTATTNNNKRKHSDNTDYNSLTDEQREINIVDALARLRDLIEERKPGMLSNYNAECQRVQEERKKLQMAALADGSAAAERRLPKRRFPWCSKSRQLLGLLAKLAGNPAKAATLLASRALPLFPSGFVRMPTLLRQADLSKEIKASEVKRQRLGSSSYIQNPLPSTPAIAMPFQEPIQFPSSLTVTTTVKTSPEKAEPEDKSKPPMFGTIVKSFSLKDDKKEDLYVPPNNIGSITITPVPQKEKKSNPIEKQPSLIRVKSPAALNEMVTKKDVKPKKPEKPKDVKRVESPLHIDTTYQTSKKDPSPKNKSPKDEVTQKQIESMKVAENNIPRPALVPVHHSPTFVKPDKRPEKKKKDIIIVTEVDPLSNEPLNVDDSSSDVEVIETDKSDSAVPSKDNSVKSVPKVKGTDEDFDTVMRNIREMEMAHSQEPTKFSNAFSSVITSSKHNSGTKNSNHRRNAVFASRSDEEFAERTSLNKMDGSKAITG